LISLLPLSLIGVPEFIDVDLHIEYHQLKDIERQSSLQDGSPVVLVQELHNNHDGPILK
jgi:hypothetical protein